MFGNMAGGPAAAAPLMGNPNAGGSMIPTPPPPMAQPQQGSVLPIIMKALQDPATMAQKMAEAGITPQQFQQAMQEHHLAATMEPTSGAAANAESAFGSDRAKTANLAGQYDIFGPQDAYGQSKDSMFADPNGYHEPATADKFIAQVEPTGGAEMPSMSAAPPTIGANSPSILDMLMQFFKGGGEGNKGATANYLGNNPQMVKGGTMPPLTGPAGMDGVPSVKVGENAPPVAPPTLPPAAASSLPPIVPYNGVPNHQIPPLVGEQYNARAANLETRGMPADMREYISNAAIQGGLDPNYLLRQAIIESGGNPKAFNEGSKASGLYQFVPSTAKQYGLSDPFDWKASTNAAVKLAQDNKAYLEKALGREPSNAELYLAHQQGAKGAADMLMNRDMPVTAFVNSKAVSSNGGDPSMSAGQFVDMWERKYNEPSLGGGTGGGSSGDTISGGAGDNSLNAGSNAGTSAGNTATPKSLQSRLADMAAALQQGSGDGDWMSAKNMNLPQAPSPVPPRPGQYDPNSQMKQLMLAMLYGGGGTQIPSLGQLIGGR